jgi:carboxypeptidase Taq
MKNELDIDKLVSEGHIDKINEWMKENVWKRADLLDADVWLKEITGRDFDPTDFLDYLEEKFSKLYELD